MIDGQAMVSDDWIDSVEKAQAPILKGGQPGASTEEFAAVMRAMGQLAAPGAGGRL